jgi:hypothetical protein
VHQQEPSRFLFRDFVKDLTRPGPVASACVPFRLTDGQRLTNQDRNFNQYGVQGRVSYAVTPEISPFVDLGKVFHSADEQPLSHLHPVGGLGFRAVVIPQVVAYVDLGTSGGGPEAFTGIDYPF